jgi:hypothetical protein
MQACIGITRRQRWRDDKAFKPSLPEMLTAIVRKQELREKVDVNFDGRISFLEYLLYQYREFCNPGDFCERSMKAVRVRHIAIFTSSNGTAKTNTNHVQKKNRLDSLKMMKSKKLVPHWMK